MVVELKTLKGFHKEVIGIEDKMINETKLRAEAVKWYKEFEKGREDSLGIKMYEEADKLECLMGFIINFFNLTEEDLK